VVKDSIDVLGLLRKRGMEGDVDFLREALAVLVQAIMEAEVTEQVGVGSGERAPERLTQRNGYRPRPWIPGQARWAYAFPISVKGASCRRSWSRGNVATCSPG